MSLIKEIWQWWIKEQKKICPHCGYYCTGKSIYCLPPDLPESEAQDEEV